MKGQEFSELRFKREEKLISRRGRLEGKAYLLKSAFLQREQMHYGVFCSCSRTSEVCHAFTFKTLFWMADRQFLLFSDRMFHISKRKKADLSHNKIKYTHRGKWMCEVLVTDVVRWLLRLVHSPCNWQEAFPLNEKLQQLPHKASVLLSLVCRKSFKNSQEIVHLTLVLAKKINPPPLL